MNKSVVVPFLFCAVFGLLLVASTALAQPMPKVGAIYPQSAQRGTTATIGFYGENLGDATGVLFSGDGGGVKADIPPSGDPAVNLVFSKGGVSTRQRTPNAAIARIEIAKDAPLGPREARVVTPDGVSNPVQFFVGDLPEIMEAEPNNGPQRSFSETSGKPAQTPDDLNVPGLSRSERKKRQEGYISAMMEERGNKGNTQAGDQSITLPVAITGKIEPANDVDSFQFNAKKGERLIFDVQAARLGSPLDSTLALYNAAGEELAQNEDANGTDALIDFTIPEDGTYRIELRDLRYQGGGNFTYRLRVGALPYLDSIYPLGGQRGKQVQVNLIGRNLDGAAALKLEIAPDAPVGFQEIRAASPKGFSNPRRFEVGDLPEVLEKENKAAPDEPMDIAVPVVANGRMNSAKDQDTYKFKLDRAQVLRFEVEASRFGSPLDALLTLTQADGAVLAQNDDAVGADALIERYFEPGEYKIAVKDLLDRGGSDFAYRLKITAPGPDFALRFFPDAPRINRGGSATLRVEVVRKSGFGGPVEVEAVNLPEGVSAERILIPAELPSGLLTLRASDNAPLAPGVSAFKLVGRGMIGGTTVSREADPVGVSDPFRAVDINNPNPPDDEAREAYLALHDAAPFRIIPIPFTVGVLQDQGGGVDVRIERRAGFAGDVSLSLQGYSAGREPISRSLDVTPLVLNAGQAQGVIPIRARPDSETGTRSVIIAGTATIDGKAIVQTSPAFPLRIEPIPFMLSNTLTRLSLTALPPGAQSAAGEAVFTVKADRRGWFNDRIPLTLEGLPEGINAEIPPVARGATEAIIKLTATDKAKVGEPVNFTVVGKVGLEGREYLHRTPPISITVTAPEPQTAEAAPASPPPAVAK